MSDTIGPYELEAQIGKGGAATVWRAQGPRGTVALKVLRLLTAAQAELLQQEAKVQTQLRHPNVVRVYELLTQAEGQQILVLELVQGSTLTEYLKDHKGIDPVQACVMFSDIARGVAYTHRHGVVHRDLKPDNVFVVSTKQGPLLKVADYGIALHKQSAKAAGAFLGTFGYQSPEQLRDADQIDHRSDVYSLGVILYEMLCGTAPFEGDFFAVCRAMVAGKFAPIEAHLGQAPPQGLSELMADMLAPDPTHRPPSVDAVLDRLEALPGVCDALPPRSILERQLRIVIDDPTFTAPPAPDTASQIHTMCGDDTASIDGVVGVIQRDPVLAGQVLHRASSPLYGVKETKSLRHAAIRLGLFTLRDIAWEVALTSAFKVKAAYSPHMNLVAQHCREVGHLTRLVCQVSGINPEPAFMAGLLHDVGLAYALMVTSERVDQPDDNALGACSSVHEAAGYRLIDSWNLGSDLAEIGGDHHVGGASVGQSDLQAAVLVADHLAHRLGSRMPEPWHRDDEPSFVTAAQRLGLDCEDPSLFDRARLVLKQAA